MFTSKTSDTKLWEAIGQNDHTAFNLLFERYWVRLYKTANTYLKDGEASEEVVHDVFLNLWSRRTDLQINSFPSFLLTAVRYQVYNRMRSAKLSVVHTADYSGFDCGTSVNTGDEKIMDFEFQREVNQHLNELPKRCQEIFLLSRVQHFSNQEISDQLGISKRTVENQLTRALKHLRLHLKNISSICLLLF